jgi:hypothetical protein
MDGCKYTVTSVDPTSYPRLTLSVGGVYNGDDDQGSEGQ